MVLKKIYEKALSGMLLSVGDDEIKAKKDEKLTKAMNKAKEKENEPEAPAEDEEAPPPDAA